MIVPCDTPEPAIDRLGTAGLGHSGIAVAISLTK